MSHKPVLLIVSKKTTVPTTKQLDICPTRSDWIKVGRIEANESKFFFSKVVNDAQFAKWIYSNWGQGEYMVSAFMKGRAGLWNFFKVICYDNRFQRMPKRFTKEDYEIRQLRGDANKLKRHMNEQLKQAQNEAEKLSIQQEFKEQRNDLLDDYELTKEIKILENQGKRQGPAPYLRSTVPLYREHEYEEPGTPHPEYAKLPKEKYNEQEKDENNQQQNKPEEVMDWC